MVNRRCGDVSRAACLHSRWWQVSMAPLIGKKRPKRLSEIVCYQCILPNHDQEDTVNFSRTYPTHKIGTGIHRLRKKLALECTVSVFTSTRRSHLSIGFRRGWTRDKHSGWHGWSYFLSGIRTLSSKDAWGGQILTNVSAKQRALQSQSGTGWEGAYGITWQIRCNWLGFGQTLCALGTTRRDIIHNCL